MDFAEMNTEGGVGESKETLRNTRSHAEVMRSLGYAPPLPLPKKPKTNWQMLLDEFPCPPFIITAFSLGSKDTAEHEEGLRISTFGLDM